MKVRVLAAIAALVLPLANALAAEYRLAIDPVDKRRLGVAVDRLDSSSKGRLVLRGARLGTGVSSQVENVSCDGRPLVADGRAAWLVPSGCNRVTWTIQLDATGGAEASKQRSIGSDDGAFCLVSEASSLPRLVPSDGPDTLILPEQRGGETVPKAGPGGRMRLPAASQPPLFLLLRSKPVAEYAEKNLQVTYFVDQSSQSKYLPPLAKEVHGLRWLMSLASAPGAAFHYAWLAAQPSGPIAGAMGNGLLLVNYIPGGTTDGVRAALVAATPLIEASHEVASKFGRRPTWAEESLATYMGLQALHYVMPNDEMPSKLQKMLEHDAARFPLGLIAVQRRVTAGDPSMYGAFFTKGVAFWSEVDAALRNAGQGGLASRASDLWRLEYDKDGRPVDLATRLQLPEEAWIQLSDRFLGV